MWTAATRFIKRTVSLLKAPSIIHTHPVFISCDLCVVDKTIIGYPLIPPTSRRQPSVSTPMCIFYLWPRISMPILCRPRLIKCSSLPVCPPCHQSLLASVSSSRDISKFILKTSPSSNLHRWMEDVWLRDPTSKHELPPCSFWYRVSFLIRLDLLGYWLWHFYYPSLLFLLTFFLSSIVIYMLVVRLSLLPSSFASTILFAFSLTFLPFEFASFYLQNCFSYLTLLVDTRRVCCS